MRILYVCPDVFLNEGPGGATHVREVASALARLGHRITIVGRKTRGDFQPVEGIELHLVGGINKPLIGFIAYSITSCIQSLVILLTHRIDAVYERHNVFGVGLLLGKIFRIPVVTEVNGILSDEARVAKAHSSVVNRIVRIIERATLRNVEKVVAVTPEIKEQVLRMSRLCPEDVVVVSNGVNTRLFTPTTGNRISLKKKFNIGEDELIVGFVGTLLPWQGLDYLIDAAHRIVGEIKNARFLIVGDGPSKGQFRDNAVKQGLDGRFIFVGSVPYKEVPEYINAFDVCAAPFTRWRIVSPLKVYEYLSCGKPVVSSRDVGLEFIEERGVGLLVDPEDSDELSGAIIELLKDEGLRREMGGRGRGLAVEEYSWEKAGAKVERVIRGHLDKQT